jgi:hypothetical protein
VPAPSRKSNRLPIIATVGCLAIICLVALAAAAYVILDPAAPRPTLVAGALSPALATPFLPVIASPTSDPVVNTVPTSTSEPTATLVPATDTPIPIPTATITPAFPPGVYITAIRVEPPDPKRRQDVTFYPTFINTTDTPKGYRMVVYVYRPNQSNSMGESTGNGITIPVGTFEFRAPGWRLGGPGGCEDFVVRVGWVDDNKRRTLFTQPDGRVPERAITVC